MSLPVLVGFAGVLVAAVATGMLAGRCVRQPRADVILWAVATLGLTVALAAQSMGFASGFGPATFRAVQLCTLLLAPLSLAWGLVELVAQSEAVRFGMRLVSGALIVVAAVILATDPLTAQPFSKSWPSTDVHSQPFSHYALDLVQVAAVAAVVLSTGLVLAYARKDPRWRSALPAVAPVGLAVLMTVALRFSLPDRSAYPLLSLMAAALVWFGMTRIQDVPGRSARGTQASGSRGSGGADGLRDSRSGSDDDYWPEDGYAADGVPAAGGGVPAGRYATYGQPRPADLRGRQAFAAVPEPGRQGPGRQGPGRQEPPGRQAGPGRQEPPGRPGSGGPGRPGSGGPDWPAGDADPARRAHAGGPPQPPGRPGWPREPGTGMPAADERPTGPRSTVSPGLGPFVSPGLGPSGLGIAASGGPETGLTAGPDPDSGPHATGSGSLAPGPAAAPARPYGRILIFTVLEDRVADFDRLAEQAAEEVRTAEPDTLVYVIHLVPNAPLQRIFYEVYRDRVAFERHENQPYMKRFVADRRACVLATNVIELRLKYAKVAPLPLPTPTPPDLPQAPRRLQPLPPPGAPRPDRPDRPSQLPSAGRRYGGG
jgi:quinol monooxygenase YgiN